MLIFRVPKDPPQKLTHSEMILDNFDYMTGSFNGFFTEDTDYFTWFLQSSAEPIMDDCPMNGSRVLIGIAHDHRASKTHLRLQVVTLQARVRDLEGAAATREGYIQEEISKSLARERDLQQREKEAYVVATERERGVNYRLRQASFMGTSAF